MPRNRDGYLKPDALRAGVPDQYAVIRDGVRHEVSIVHDVTQGGYVTQHVSIDPVENVREVHAWQVAENITLARFIFKREVTRLGGRV